MEIYRDFSLFFPTDLTSFNLQQQVNVNEETTLKTVHHAKSAVY